MLSFDAQAIKTREVESDEADFPLPIADPDIPPMHRQCVLRGCSYRSPFLFAAGWMLAVVFFITTLGIAFYGITAQQALLKENALLIQMLRERPAAAVVPSVPGVPLAPVVSSAPIGPPAPVDAPAASPEPTTMPAAPAPPQRPPSLPAREKVTSPRPSKTYTVPESEKWWNRP